MSAFDPTQHPRGNAGQFSSKPQSEAEVDLFGGEISEAEARFCRSHPEHLMVTGVQRLRAGLVVVSALDADDPDVVHRFHVSDEDYNGFVRSPDGVPFIEPDHTFADVVAPPSYRGVDTSGLVGEDLARVNEELDRPRADRTSPTLREIAQEHGFTGKFVHADEATGERTYWLEQQWEEGSPLGAYYPVSRELWDAIPAPGRE
ncbi:hypothetical protein [Pseudoclavibacter soli]|uniref:hypothetical protein n=1 Tax=Pseudoclavibacter soli TaxID=452623 RepID=UPI000414BAC0|nr:hypothetical protein [Pseudoclavibacter soli]